MENESKKIHEELALKFKTLHKELGCPSCYFATIKNLYILPCCTHPLGALVKPDRQKCLRFKSVRWHTRNQLSLFLKEKKDESQKP